MLYYKEVLEEDFPKDIAVLFFQNDYKYNEILDTLKTDYGITFKNAKYEFLMEGKYKGKTVFEYYREENGELLYKNRVQGITVFGLHPGISEVEAKKLIEKYGFYMGNYSYKMGDCLMNLNTKGGEVQSINIRYGSEYAG